MAAFAQFEADVEPVRVRESQVQQHQVGGLGPQRGGPVVTQSTSKPYRTNPRRSDPATD